MVIDYNKALFINLFFLFIIKSLQDNCISQKEEIKENEKRICQTIQNENNVCIEDNGN